MTAIFRINQDSVNGTWGEARTNLELFGDAGSVTLEAQDSHATYLWEIIGDMEGNTGTLSAPTSSVSTIDLDVTGGYIVRLTVDALLVTEDILELKLGIPLVNSAIVIPAARETVQDNQFVGSAAGYHIWLHRLWKWIDANAGGSGVTDHGALTGLADDDHNQYALLAGRTGGQEIAGGTGTGDSLELKATVGVGASGSNVDLLVGNDGGTLALRATHEGKVGIGTAAPAEMFSVNNKATINSAGLFRFEQPLATDYDALAFGEGPTINAFTLQALLAGTGDANTLNFRSGGVANILTMTAVAGNIGINQGAPTEKLHVVGSIRMVDGHESLGKRITDSDGNGTGKWEAGVAPTQSRTSTIILDEDDERLTITDGPKTVTVPAAPTHGKSYRIMNANGVTKGSGNASNVTLDITGTTVQFNGGSAVGNNLILPDDGDWAYIWFDEDFGSAGTWWVNSNLSVNTGNPV